MPVVEVEAILLRSVEVGEADRIVHLLTPDFGRISAMAKSARKSVKRFPGTLDLMNHLRVSLQRRPGRMDYLSKAELIDPLLPLRSHPARFGLGCYLIELLGRLSPEGGDPAESRELFDFALSALHLIESHPLDQRLRIFLELRTLAALGLQPQLAECVRCGRGLEPPGPFGFHVGDGGVVCRRCQGGEVGLLGTHLGTLRALDQALRFELDQIDRIALAPDDLVEAELLVERFLRFHAGVELRSEAFLREAFGGVARSPA